MSEAVIAELLKEHESELATLAQNLSEGCSEKAVAGLAGLFTTVVTGVPALGSLVDHGLARVFGKSANDTLDEQVADWGKEQERRALVD